MSYGGHDCICDPFRVTAVMAVMAGITAVMAVMAGPCRCCCWREAARLVVAGSGCVLRHAASQRRHPGATRTRQCGTARQAGSCQAGSCPHPRSCHPTPAPGSCQQTQCNKDCGGPCGPNGKRPASAELFFFYAVKHATTLIRHLRSGSGTGRLDRNAHFTTRAL